jgi:TonB family protein
MHQAGLFLCMLLLMAMTASARQAPSQPDAQGVYSLSKGIEAPKLIRAVAAVYPDNPEVAKLKHVSSLVVVVGVDGIPTEVETRSVEINPFDQEAISVVKQSRFEPGTFHGTPVPVRIVVVVPFAQKDRPAIPEIFSMKKATFPRLLNDVKAESTYAARKNQVQGGVVVVGIVVTEDGLPTNAHVLRPVGYGLDESALEAVSKYRFKPAEIDGIPVSVEVTVQVPFE